MGLYGATHFALPKQSIRHLARRNPAMRIRHYTAFLSGFLISLAAATVSAAEPTARSATAKLLLEKGWDKTPEARKIADLLKQDAPPLTDDPLVLNAHWLILMHQGRYDDALPSVQAFVKSQSDDISALSAMRAEVWIHTVKHDYRLAIAVADRLAKAASPHPPSTDQAVLAAQEQAIRFLGRFAGFGAGPAETRADQHLCQRFEASLIARLNEPLKEKFEEAKAATLSRFRQRVTSASDATHEAKSASADEQAKKLDSLTKEGAQLNQDAIKVEEKGKQLADDLQKRLADLDRQDEPWKRQQFALQGQVNALFTQLRQEQATARGLEQLAAGEKNAALRLDRQRDADRAAYTANITRQRLETAKVQLANTVVQRNGIQQQRDAARNWAITQGLQLQNQEKGIELDKLKNDNKQKRAEKAKPTTNGKAISLEIKARAFGTYDEFPFEELRAALMAKLQ